MPLWYQDKINVLCTFSGKIQVHVFEGHHHNIWGLEDDALHDILFPGGYAQVQALSVGCIQHQVTLENTVMFIRVKWKWSNWWVTVGDGLTMLAEETLDSINKKVLILNKWIIKFVADE